MVTSVPQGLFFLRPTQLCVVIYSVFTKGFLLSLGNANFKKDPVTFFIAFGISIQIHRFHFGIFQHNLFILLWPFTPPPRQPLWSQHTCFMTTSFLHNFCPVPRQWSRCGSMAHPHSPERQLLGWVHDREHVALSFLSLGYFGSYNNFQTRSFILHIAKYNPTVDIRYIFFHYPSVNGYPGWLYFLAAMNRAAINRVVQTSQWGTQRP